MSHDDIFDILYSRLKFVEFRGVPGYKVSYQGINPTVLEYRTRENSFIYNVLNRDFYRTSWDENESFGNSHIYEGTELGELEIQNYINPSDDKISIIEMSLNPVPYDYFEEAFENFICKDHKILHGLIKKNIILFINFTLEANWFGDSFDPEDVFKTQTYYDVLLRLYKKYNIPKESIIFLNSNLMGGDLDNINGFANHINVWYDCFWEHETFRRPKGNVKSLDYTFEEHFEELKKNHKSNFLRLNRTNTPHRDLLLYWIYKLGSESNFLIEHNTISHLNKEYINYVVDYFNISFDDTSKKENGYDSIIKNIEYDESIVTNLRNKLPIKAIESEFTNKGMIYDRIENETIPHEVYTHAPLSYVATSFPNIKNYVFLNMGVFNPIYYYHPLLFLSNEHTLYYFKKSGYKSFDFIFDERYDKYSDIHDRMLLTYKETDRINKLEKNKILDIIWDNQDILKYNRSKLIQNKSIQNFIEKLCGHVISNYKKTL